MNKPETQPLKLARSVNLIKGYKNGWNPMNDVLDILSYSTSEALPPVDISPPKELGYWDYPEVTLHDSANELITAVLNYGIVNPDQDHSLPETPCGSMLFGGPQGAERVKSLENTLGVPLSTNDYRYALVSLERFDGAQFHQTKENGSTPMESNREWIRNIACLPKYGVGPGNLNTMGLTKSDATEYLNLMKEWGTHYISGVSIGDRIFQVFAYTPEKFEKVKSTYSGQEEKLSGYKSVSFVSFTADANKGQFGYVSHFGSLINQSNCDQFKSSKDEGKWIDPKWSNYQQSVFAPFLSESALTFEQLEADFKEQVPLKIELSPLTALIEYKRTKLWNHVYKCAMSTVFEDAINANFQPLSSENFENIFPQDQEGFVSRLTTPKINVYKTYLQLDSMQLLQPEKVNTFSAFGYVLSGRSKDPIIIPGIERVSICSYILDMRTQGNPTILRLSDDGFRNYYLACGEFYGALRLEKESQDESVLIVEGLCFKLDEHEQPYVTKDIRTPLSEHALENFKTSIALSLSFAQAVLGYQSNDTNSIEVQNIVRNHTGWLADSLPVQTEDKNIAQLRFILLKYSKFESNGDNGSFVPILEADKYEKSLTAILDLIKEIDLQTKQNSDDIEKQKRLEAENIALQTINQNIIESGQLVSNIVDANAAQQQDLSDHYDRIILSLTEESSKQEIQIINLQNQVYEQQAAVNTAVDEYKQAVILWEAIQGVKLALSIATSLFSFVKDVYVPSADSEKDVVSMGKGAQRFQKTLKGFNHLYSCIEDTSTGIIGMINAGQALSQLDDTVGNTNNSDWSELSERFDNMLAHGPSDKLVKASAANLKTEFKILIIRNKALTNAKSQLVQINSNVLANQQQKKLNDDQKDRLNALSSSLNPKDIEDLDLAEIDLISLTGELENIRLQALSILSCAFTLEDQALCYQNLQDPTIIGGYDIISLQHARTHQLFAANRAEAKLNAIQASRTKEIEYRIEGVPVDELIDGKMFRFQIPLTAKEFANYTTARVDKVVVSVDNVISTNSGKALLALDFTNNTFFDRDIEGNVLAFNTPVRRRTYEYDSKTGEPLFIDQGDSWSKDCSRVTPFGEWQTYFTNNGPTNEGICFGALTTTVRLKFFLETRINDAIISNNTKPNNLKMNRTVVSSTSPTPTPTFSQLLNELSKKGSITNGWDVVYSMSLDKINESLEEQYKSLQLNEEFDNLIEFDVNYSITHGPGPKEMYPIAMKDSYQVKYGYPKMCFNTNNEKKVHLKMDILPDSNVINGYQAANEGTMTFSDPDPILANSMDVDIELSQVKGNGTDKKDDGDTFLKLVIEMEKGTFQISDIELNPSQQIEINNAIKSYFYKNNIAFLINCLNISETPVTNALKPTGFLFTTVSKEVYGIDMLQLFIQTDGRKLLSYQKASLRGISFSPIPDKCDCSLIIRSELFFGDVLTASMSESNWKIESKKNEIAESENASYQSVFTSAKSEVENVNLDLATSVTFSPTTGDKFERKFWLPNNRVTWDLSGMTISPTEYGHMQLFCDKTQRQPITQEYSEYKSWGTKTAGPTESTIYSNLTSLISTTMPLEISGEGRNQDIQIKINPATVTASGHLSGGGACGTDDIDAKVNQKVKEVMPTQIVSALNCSLTPLSLFALKNILFPEENYISFSNIGVPGDAIITGTINTTTDDEDKDNSSN